jgi:hypothetical protein
MHTLFANLSLADVHQEVSRNIVALRKPQNLFDDLTDDPAAWQLAQRIEDVTKPPVYRSPSPLIDRPFENADWFNAIAWPYTYWQASRFSNGSYGVWYGSDTVETSVYESVYHWYSGFLADAGFEHESVVVERKVYSVTCAAALLDFRPLTAQYADLLHTSDYAYAQTVGARIHREGHPGLLIQSVRRSEGENVAIFNPVVLSNPKLDCELTYRLDGDQILIEKQPGKVWLSLDAVR